MSKTIENLKTGNYKVVDNQGVSVTIHFLECLEKEFADLEAKLAGMTKKYELASCPTGGLVDRVRNLEQQLAEKENMHLLDEKEFQHYCAYKQIETEIKGCLDREREYKKQLAEKDKEIEKLKEWQQWYEMWYKKFQKQIEDLTTELETYRPTKLHGNGQCECFKCKQEGRQAREWTDWCSRYKGHTYCDDCLKEVLKEEQTPQTKLAIQELEKVKEKINKLPITDILDTDYGGFKKIYQTDAMRIIDRQINELKGEKDVED